MRLTESSAHLKGAYDNRAFPCGVIYSLVQRLSICTNQTYSVTTPLKIKLVCSTISEFKRTIKSEFKSTIKSTHLSNHDHLCVSASASPSPSCVTRWNRSLCHCPNCPVHLLLSRFRQDTAKGRVSVKQNENVSTSFIRRPQLIQHLLK